MVGDGSSVVVGWCWCVFFFCWLLILLILFLFVFFVGEMVSLWGFVSGDFDIFWMVV